MSARIDAITKESAGVQRAMRVLVADDDRDAASTLGVLLSMHGHEVREVYRGDAVLRYVREFEPQAVLLDITMPGMSGYDVVRELLALYGAERPLLIAVTASDKGADRILGKLIGFDHYVTKPYRIEELLELLKPRQRQRNYR